MPATSLRKQNTGKGRLLTAERPRKECVWWGIMKIEFGFINEARRSQKHFNSTFFNLCAFCNMLQEHILKKSSVFVQRNHSYCKLLLGNSSFERTDKTMLSLSLYLHTLSLTNLSVFAARHVFEPLLKQIF